MIRGKIIFGIAAIAIVSSLISGCLSSPQSPTGTPTPVVTPVMTTTATATPVPTMPRPTPAPIPYSVEVLSAPATAAAGQSFMVSWRVNSPVQETINYTAVHYGPDSMSENLTLSSYPGKTDVLNGTIPADFSTNITIGKTGVFYFRVYAIIDGTNYWSAEKTVNITIPATVSIKVTPTATATTSGYGGYGY